MSKEKYKLTVAIRQKTNRDILAELSEIVEKNPTLRFNQILLNYALPSTRKLVIEEYRSIDGQAWESAIYNEEPAVTYARLMESLKSSGENHE